MGRYVELCIVQSVFSLASRGNAVRGRAAVGRDGELKTGWTKPPGRMPAMGV